MMEVVHYIDREGYYHGHYLKHPASASHSCARISGIGKYKCPKCKKVFKTKTKRPHCPNCDFGLCKRIKRGTKC